eukprot:7387835-Prymnesium_polylepis.1
MSAIPRKRLPLSVNSVQTIAIDAHRAARVRMNRTAGISTCNVACANGKGTTWGRAGACGRSNFVGAYLFKTRVLLFILRGRRDARESERERASRSASGCFTFEA